MKFDSILKSMASGFGVALLALFITVQPYTYAEPAATEEEVAFVADSPCTLNVFENSAHAVWSTNLDSAAYVKISSDTDENFRTPVSFYDSKDGIKNIDKFHVVKFDGLKPDTEYYYTAYSVKVKRDANGKLSGEDKLSSEPVKFRTSGGETARPIKFLMVNDMHCMVEKLNCLLKYSDTCDFVVYNGDMVSDMVSAEQMRECCFLPASNLKMPLYYVRGNHETRGNFSSQFAKMSPTEDGKTYFYFKYGKTFFVVLDVGEDKCDSDEEYFGLANFDKFRASQAGWFESLAKLPEFKNADARIIIAHVPPSGCSPWHGSLHFNAAVGSSVKGNNIDVYLAGHTHRNMLIKPDKNGFDMPVVVNSCNDALLVSIDGKNIDMQSISQGGESIKIDWKSGGNFPKHKK